MVMQYELSNQLEAFSERQATRNRQDEQEASGRDDCMLNRDEISSRRTSRFDRLRMTRVKADRGDGEESVQCISFRQASTLGLILVLLSSVLFDAVVMFLVIGGTISTVSMAHELRLETLKRRQEHQELRQALYDTTLELKLAMRELDQAQERLGLEFDLDGDFES